ncbi:MAG: hypothetical protein QOI78_3087 [Actinomycetota bacterium]|nr:hypothetical protein [Actinomycetota bacterium]
MTDPVNRFYDSGVTFTVTTTSDSTVVAATGDLDLTVADRLLGRLTDEIALRPRALIVDLTRVSFCSSQGLCVLLTATADAHSAGIPCAVVSDQRAVRRPIAVLELGQLLQVHDNLVAAGEWLKVLDGVCEGAVLTAVQEPEGALPRTTKSGSGG